MSNRANVKISVSNPGFFLSDEETYVFGTLELMVKEHQDLMLDWIKANINACVNGDCPDFEGCTDLEWK